MFSAGGDRHYTNGIEAIWAFEPVDGHWARRFAEALPGWSASSLKGVAYRFGQQIYTPEDSEAEALIEDDRPYAGLLFGGVSLLNNTQHGGWRMAESLHIDVGIVGPASRAGKLQRDFHEWITADDPNGWDNQLENELIANLAYKRAWVFQQHFSSLEVEVAMLASVPLSRFLLSRVARQGADTRETRTDRVMSNIANGLKTWSLHTTLSNKKRAGAMVGGALVLFVLAMVAATKVPLVLYPDNDGLNLGINIELPPSTTLDSSQKVADAVGELLRDKPYFDTIIKQVGRKSPMAGGSALNPSDAENFIGFSITFTELSERDQPSYVLANEIRTELSGYLEKNVPGASLLVQAESGGPSTEDPISIALSGDDMDELQHLSTQVQELLRRTPGTTDVRDNLGTVKTEITLRPNREATDFYGLSQQDLATQIRLSMANDKIDTFATGGTQDDLDIHMSLSWGSRNGEAGGPTQLAEMSKIRAFRPSGETVPLLSLLDPNVTESPTSIIHKEGERTISVLSKVDGRNLNAIIAELTPKLEQAQRNWPPGYTWSIGGESEEMAETFGSAGVMLMVALIMVFGVLVIVFGSFSQALILMTTMPLALIGTFIGFWLTGMSLSFFAVIGVVSLIGIVANNGIVMVDTMNRLLRNGAEIAEAAAEGAATRLRPILTTSITTVVGLVPLAIGSPMYAPLCYAIIFGLVASTALSHYRALPVSPAYPGKSAQRQHSGLNDHAHSQPDDCGSVLVSGREKQ